MERRARAERVERGRCAGVTTDADLQNVQVRGVTLAARQGEAIAHRGPDDAGTWADPGAGLVLSHRRLSILDLSPEGHQPMLTRDGRWALVFNGEIYNHGALRAELATLGHSFRGHSDTEVLLAAIGEWGVEQALQRSNGMLALAAWDRKQRRLWLARDRMGKKLGWPTINVRPEGEQWIHAVP